MNNKYAIILSLLLFLNPAIHAQSMGKQITAKRITGNIKIDGNLDEADWKNAPLATNFIELRPITNNKEEEINKTEIYILYSNIGLYIGGYCHERNKDSIATELVGRDNFGNNDFVGVVFDTYYDKINGTEYFVTPLGEQMDAKLVPNNNGNNEDFGWSSVWQNACRIQKDGWTFEMLIPYSALRFSKKDIQVWGFNIVRKRNKSGKQLFWNPIDPQKNGFLTQEGTLTIPDKIIPPMRLSFSPYLSTYVNNYPYNTPGVKNTSGSVNGGMDVKYGINESFTLDATLVPDFGQVQSDNQVLNLTPFETKFNENRAFFTEGTELFNKGSLFYSRRIGAAPLHYWEVTDTSATNTYSHILPGEHFIKNPSESRLINATKISGRTKGKLGIGFFNALTQPMYASVEDDHGNKRKIETAPLTNYNILVLDQSLKNNSSITLVNTNVMRSGNDYDANVTAGLFDLYDKKNKWNLNGNAYTSSLIGKTTTQGFKYGIGFGKVSGAFNFNTTMQVIDDKFNPNDLGIQFFNNDINNSFYAGYSITKPHKRYNRLFNNINLTIDQRFYPRSYQSCQFNYNFNIQLKNLWWLGGFTNIVLAGNDFYEPRIAGLVYKSPANYNQGFFVQTNQAKKYYINLVVYGGSTDMFRSKEFYTELTEIYRFNTRFSIEHFISRDPITDNAGYSGTYSSAAGNTVLFGRRDRNTIENRLKFKYSFNNKMYVTMRVRHYWSKVTNKESYVLNPSGMLDKTDHSNNSLNQFITDNHNFDRNYNIFNVDMLYSWRFAPGSEFNIGWKNGINTFEQDVVRGYLKNFNNTLASPQNNSISLKLLYYIDYLTLKRKR